MPTFTTERPVRHSAEEMFDLVADCEAYPEFVPLCDNLVITGRDRQDGKGILIADMTVAYGPWRETFTTRDVLDRDALTIDVTYLTGPFRRFDSRWRFEPVDATQSIVHFAVEYEFRSRVLGGLMAAAFDRAFRKLASAFEARADAVYGARAAV